MTMNTPSNGRRRLLQIAVAGCFAAMLAPVRAADPIKIGFGMSLTGPNAGAGRVFLLGRDTRSMNTPNISMTSPHHMFTCPPFVNAALLAVGSRKP